MTAIGRPTKFKTIMARPGVQSHAPFPPAPCPFPPPPGPQRRKLKPYQDQHGWIADDLALDDASFYWNSTAAAGEAEDDVVLRLSARSDRGNVWDHARTAAVAGGGNAARYTAGWGGGSAEDRPAADYVYGGSAMEEDAWFADGAGRGFGYDYDEGDGDGEGESAVDPARRRLARGKATAMFPGVPWTEIWGEWGKDGERIFDDTCYQRRERVIPVSDLLLEVKLVKRLPTGNEFLRTIVCC